MATATTLLDKLVAMRDRECEHCRDGVKVGRSLDLEPERWRLRLNTDAAREAAREWVHDHEDERGTAICWIVAHPCPVVPASPRQYSFRSLMEEWITVGHAAPHTPRVDPPPAQAHGVPGPGSAALWPGPLAAALYSQP